MVVPLVVVTEAFGSSHWAYSVMSSFGVQYPLSAYVVPEPLASVFQPAKAKPSRVKVQEGSDLVPLMVTSCIVPVPPLGLKVIV